jgi:alkaline phosphatase D
MSTRREFLGTLSALGAASVLPGCAAARPGPARDPFTLGVASGYPRPSGFVVWTRLAPDPERGDGGLDPVAVPVRWEVATDESMRSVVAAGSAVASPDWAHSVHVEVAGLEPGRWYAYRFSAGDARSAIGRARTAPPADAPVPALRFAFASCQQYEQGYFGAYRHIVADSPDLIAFLGDYIYESSWGRHHVRSHFGGEPYSLDEYRARYALYRRDADLQAAHAACPWIVTWDDHEVDNDYANDRSEDGMDRERFLARRAAAYRAYYEHMPLPARMRPVGPDMRVYAELGWGRLASFFLLDDRQYRSPQVCPRRGRSGGSNVVDVDRCPEIHSPERTMLGAAQERWLEQALGRSGARWNVLAQQTRMAQFDQQLGPGRSAWTDGWDGYPAARRRLIESLVAQRVANPVVIGGDVHMFTVSDLKADFDDPASPVVASELVGTSITSQGPAQRRVDERLPENPHVRFADSRYRGYVRVDVTGKAMRADLRAMESVGRPDAACRTLASFAVEDGRPGPKPV